MNNTALGIGLAGLLANLVKGAARNSEEDRVRQSFSDWRQRFQPETRSLNTTVQGQDGAPDMPMNVDFRGQAAGVDDNALADLYARIGGEESAQPFIRAGESMYRQNQTEEARRTAENAKRADLAAREDHDAQEAAGKIAQQQYDLMMQRMDLTPEGEKYLSQLPEQVSRRKFTGNVKDESGKEYPAFKARSPKKQWANTKEVMGSDGRLHVIGQDTETGEWKDSTPDVQGATNVPTYRDQNPVIRGGRGTSNKAEKDVAKMHQARVQYGAAVKALQNAEANKVLTRNGVGYKAVMPRGLKNIETTNPQDIKDAIKFYQSEYDGVTQALRDRGAIERNAQPGAAGSTGSRTPSKYR